MSAPTSTPPPNPILSYYNEWVDRTPYVTRTSLIGIVIISLLSWFISVDLQLSNIPYYTVIGFEVYRILTSLLVGNSFIAIIFIFLFFPQMGGRLESSMGSASYLHLIGSLSIIVNILFVTICFVLSFMGMPGALFLACNGFWIVIFAFITIDCLQIPDAPRQLMFIPIDIPSKYFPLLLLALFTILNGSDYGSTLSFAISMLVGFLYSKGYLDRMKLTSYYLEELENSNGCLHGLSRNRGWVLAGGGGHDSWIAVNANDPDLITSNNRTSTNISGGNTSSFPNIGGFGNFRGGGGGGGDDEESGPDGPKKEAVAFPGSGRTLTSSSGSNTSSITSSFFGSTSTPITSLSSNNSISSSSNTIASKEAIAQRRLAALGALNSNTTHVQSPPSNPSNPSPALQKLLDMGFTRNDATRALERSNGDFAGAMQILTS